VARKNKDKIIKVKGLSLDFDSEKLNKIEFLSGYQFKNPLNPCNKSWKNFEIVDDKRVIPNMSHDELASYIESWDKKATHLGAKNVESEDLQDAEYRFSFLRDEIFNMVCVTMGKSRRGQWWNLD
jgi:hypothetical protein